MLIADKKEPQKLIAGNFIKNPEDGFTVGTGDAVISRLSVRTTNLIFCTALGISVTGEPLKNFLTHAFDQTDPAWLSEQISTSFLRQELASNHCKLYAWNFDSTATSGATLRIREALNMVESNLNLQGVLTSKLPGPLGRFDPLVPSESFVGLTSTGLPFVQAAAPHDFSKFTY